MYNLKRFLFLGICLLVCLSSVNAQKKSVKITGKIFDKEMNEGVAQATIQLLSLPDSVMTKGTTTNLEGGFVLSGIKPNNYILRVSFIGYKPIIRQIEQGKLDKDLDLGQLNLKLDAILLNEAVITAEVPTVTLINDTVVFNAAAYRVPQNAMLEELVKKLPGAQVDSEGKIKINGKDITKIMIDGKEFFSKDPDVAMKNLPVDMIERIKSYDKKSDQARITGIDDGNEETVLDLSVKKNMNQGWFGNADVGVGNHDRYSAKGMINRFKDGDQMTGIANFNNVRDASVGGGRRWGRQNGMQEMKSGGANIAFERKKVTIGGSVNYSDRETDMQTKRSSETFLQNGSSYSQGLSNSLNNNKSFNSDFKFEWKLDSMTTLLFYPSLNFGKSNSASNSDSKTGELEDFENWNDMISNNRAINSNISRSSSTGDSFSTGGYMMFNRKLNNKGRNIGLDVNYNVGSNDNKSDSYSLIEYFKLDDQGNKLRDDEKRDLFTRNDNVNNSIRVKVNYSEPVAKNRFLQFSYSYQRSYNKTDRKTYNKLDWTNGGEVGSIEDDNFLDRDLSRKAKNYYDNQEFNINLNTIKEKYTYNIGFSVQPQKNRMAYAQGVLDVDTVRNVVNFTPVIDYRYKFNKQSQLRLMYRGRTGQPNMTDLLPIRDITDPLNIREGNPGLKPSYTNMLMMFYNNYFSKSQRSVMANVYFQNVMNSVSTKVTYDESSGGRITRPENINGNWSVSSYAGFNTPFKNKKFTVSNYANLRYNNIVGYLSTNINAEAEKNKTRNLIAGNNLTFNYRNDWFESGLNGNVSYSKVKNTLQPQSNRETYDYTIGLNSNVQIPWDMSVSTDISYVMRKGYSQGADNNEMIWNAQISKSFLKKKQATLSFQMFDILRQRSNLSRSISASMRTDTEYNEISNFFMVHFIYKLNTFGGKGSSARGGDSRGHGRQRGSGGGGGRMRAVAF